MKIFSLIGKGFKSSFQVWGLVGILFILNLIRNFSIPIYTPGQAVPAKVIILSIVFLLLGIFLTGGILSILRQAIEKKKREWNIFLPNCAKYFLRILGFLLIVTGLIIVTVGLILGIFLLIRNDMARIIIAIIITGIGLYFLFLFILTPYIIVGENKGPITSMKESISIIRNNLLKASVYTLIAFLILLIIIFIFGIVIGFISFQGKAGLSISKVLFAIISAYTNILAQAFLLSLLLDLKKDKSITPEPTG